MCFHHAVSDLLRLKSCTVDLAAQRVIRGGSEEALTDQESALLAYLSQRPGLAVSRKDLLIDVLGFAPTVVLTITVERDEKYRRQHIHCKRLTTNCQRAVAAA